MSTRMQSRYPYKPSENELANFQYKNVSWLFDELSDNNASDNGLSLSASVAGNDAILMVHQIIACYNTCARDCILQYQLHLHFV